MEDRDRKDRDRFDAVIDATFRQALRLAASDPLIALAGAKILVHQKRAAAIRRDLYRRGIVVPAVMMVSLTSRCNLTCKGCYMRAQNRDREPEMTADQLAGLVDQASELGVSAMVFAGGEPLLRSKEIVGLAAQYPRILFSFFSNGLLIDETMARSIGTRKNLVPVISFEGFRAETDLRRGNGVFDRLLLTCSLLRGKHIFFGCSVTVTSRNITQVLDEAFISQMIGEGARVLVFVEYVPIEHGTEDLVLSDEHRKALSGALRSFARKFPALFIGFPGDEEEYDGCLAAGRGFVHVSSAGALEPCPAAPFSDKDLTTTPLKDALRSELLEKIRRNHDLLTETRGGCALWTNREFVGTLTGNFQEERS
jgi:MoaA/NifB/PqqE/SkfB family radical SAM enzyme